MSPPGETQEPEIREAEEPGPAFDQVEQQLGAAVQVKALPAAGETAEAAYAAAREADVWEGDHCRVRDA